MPDDTTFAGLGFTVLDPNQNVSSEGLTTSETHVYTDNLNANQGETP